MALEKTGPAVCDGEVLLQKEIIQARVRELGEQISSEYRGTEPLLIGILNGVVFFFSDLVRQISIPTKIDFIRASSYGSEKNSQGRIRITKDVEIPLEGESVIIVEDIVDTGLTLSCIKEMIEERGAKSCRICALIDKGERREMSVDIDYCGFSIKEGFVVGYGLDYGERYRYLNDIWVLR
jgi:hypoxanthine phosphoribosyltransferase